LEPLTLLQWVQVLAVALPAAGLSLLSDRIKVRLTADANGR